MYSNYEICFSREFHPKGWKGSKFSPINPRKSTALSPQTHEIEDIIRLMEEILHQLRYIKPYEYWDICHINWCRISAINSIIQNKILLFVSFLEIPKKNNGYQKLSAGISKNGITFPHLSDHHKDPSCPSRGHPHDMNANLFGRDRFFSVGNRFFFGCPF